MLDSNHNPHIQSAHIDIGKMALPINIDDLVNHRKVESARIEYKEGWNPEKVLHTLCAFANDIDNRPSTVPVTDPVKKLLAALRDGPCSPSDLRIALASSTARHSGRTTSIQLYGVALFAQKTAFLLMIQTFATRSQIWGIGFSNHSRQK